ncbi:MAG: biopolymer transporter ExbD [Rhodanobacter sp.]
MSVSLGGDSSGPMSEINVTPLVDVMLVLLIIFMITAPLMSHSVTIELPIANPHSKTPDAKTPPLDLAIKTDGSLYFDDHAVNDAELRAKFLVEAQRTPQPQLQIRADRDVQFMVVKKIINDAKASGMVHVAFMTTDAPKG